MKYRGQGSSFSKGTVVGKSLCCLDLKGKVSQARSAVEKTCQPLGSLCQGPPTLKKALSSQNNKDKPSISGEPSVSAPTSKSTSGTGSEAQQKLEVGSSAGKWMGK